MIPNFLLFSLFGLCAVANAADHCDNSFKSTFLNNVKEAQALNRKFRTLEPTDTCQGDEMACINNTIVRCDGTSWASDLQAALGACSDVKTCVALPSVSKEGTEVNCIEDNADSLFEDCGAEGGRFGESTEEEESSTDDSGGCSDEFGSAIMCTSTHGIAATPIVNASQKYDPTSTSASGGRGRNTSLSATSQLTLTTYGRPTPITITLQAESSVPTTNPDAGTPSVSAATVVETFTVSPQDASALVSSIFANGGSITGISLPIILPTLLPDSSAGSGSCD